MSEKSVFDRSEDSIEKELMSGDAVFRRNWWGIGIALLVILVIAAVIATIAALLTTGISDIDSRMSPFTLTDVSFKNLSGFDSQIHWVQAVLDRYITVIFCHTYSFPELFACSQCIQMALVDGQLDYFVVGAYFSEELPVGPTKNGRERLSLFSWNPAHESNDFVFVYNNNIYYQPSVHEAAKMITTTGSFNVYNGVPDWLYEEEILCNSVALWWSQSGEHLAFVSFNDSQVKNITLNYYGSSQFSSERVISYAKVNENIPRVTLFVWSKSSKTMKELKPPAVVSDLKEYYLLRVEWMRQENPRSFSAEGEKLIVTWTNRAQNQLYVSLCTILTDHCVVNYVQNYSNYWVEPNAGSVQFASADSYFVLLPRWHSPDVGFYSHVAAVTVTKNGLFGRSRFVTGGAFEVTQIVGYNEAIEKIIDALESDPSKMKCLSCTLVPDNCTYVNALFSPDSSNYVLYCLGPGIPHTLLFSVYRNDTVMLIEDNTALRDYARKKQFPLVQYKDIRITDEFTAVVKLLLPPQFEYTPSRQVHPVILRVYAGPNSQAALDIWPLMDQKGLFDAFLATSRRYIIVYIDGRGSACRGSRYLEAVHKNLGDFEIADQLTVFKSLQEMNFFDWWKTAVWGWSYGGFATARIIQDDAFRTFSCATSVAPVTNFLLYDATYTERYMGLYTSSNVLKYKNTDLTKNVSAFGKGSYLLVHGTLDDNVHFQNSALLVEALVKAGVQFQFMMYANADHSLNNNTLHFFTMLDDFWNKCFRQSSAATV
ncbi:unnamed protein product [Soboliphyme baturini]|uniref:Dipeptidyl aminopeptidase-like protein 6 n=1 Tax=Soboliphyme baturini TaxID=241478 RepID=A0A183IK06_9BILA|nr:unnamed protein product [Soboliphyme baturini]